MPIKISLKFVPKDRINNIPALVQIMAWRRPGDKPLSEPMMVSLPTHICGLNELMQKLHFSCISDQLGCKNIDDIFNYYVSNAYSSRTQFLKMSSLNPVQNQINSLHRIMHSFCFYLFSLVCLLLPAANNISNTIIWCN